MQASLNTPTVADALGVIADAYPGELAEGWDAYGLICGDLNSSAARILLAVDPVPAVVAEAVAGAYTMIVTHHPLFLSGVTSVAADTVPGRTVHDLIRADIALANAHTNADNAFPGVSDALAAALGVQDCVPLSPLSDPKTGLGRIGSLAEPMSLGDFADRVSTALPGTAHGVRVAGDAILRVTRVAVCGGSGDSLLPVATAAGADVYVTSDLKHHRIQDHVLAGGCAVIDVSHWASEWPWLEDLARVLRAGLPGATVDVSRVVTDPWTAHLRSLP
jgi:dinuclear metal center YbgI/SA1388 family protein